MPLSIRSKLVLLAGVPVLGALFLAERVFSSAEEQSRKADALSSVESLSVLSSRMTRVMKDLQRERAEVLRALTCVNAVVIFDEDTPYDIISLVQPDVLVKGVDWAADRIVGRDLVEARGGAVVRIELAPGFSTTTLVERIRLLH